jgi:hypothetical protein
LVAAARVVLCSDTGVAHLATAYRTPSVVLFGPVGPADWGPPPGRLRHRALWSGRHGDPAADRADPGLLSFTPLDVLRAASSIAGDAGDGDARAAGRDEMSRSIRDEQVMRRPRATGHIPGARTNRRCISG